MIRRVLAGVLAALAGLGVGGIVLAGADSGRAPTLPAGPGTTVLAAVVTAVAVGVVAGLTGRRRWAGTAVLVVPWVALGAGGAAGIATIGLAVAASGASVGAVGFLLLTASWRTGSGGPVDPTDPVTPGVPRRRVLLAGALVAIGLGAAGVTGYLGVARAETAPAARDRARARFGGQAPLLRDPVVNARDAGAVGDGVADDSAALARALADAGARRGTLYLPAGSYRLGDGQPLEPLSGVTIAGDPGRTTLVTARSSAEFTTLCALDADQITVDGLRVTRAADVPTVFFTVGEAPGLTFSRMVLDGAGDRFRSAYAHGIQLGIRNGTTSRGLLVDTTTLTGLTYGLFQANASTATTENIEVRDCDVAGNAETGFEFNSPYGAMRDVRVTRCTFGQGGGRGFGVGLARVDGAVVRDNSFTDFAQEAIHVEDDSTDVLVEANRFTRCGLDSDSHVQVISGCRGVRVIDNTCDAGENTAAIYVVNVLPGGRGLSAGGRPIVGPSDVTVAGNDITCSTPVRAVFFQEVRGGTIRDNVVRGPGVAATATETAEQRAFDLLDSDGTVVTGNEINGVRS